MTESGIATVQASLTLDLGAEALRDLAERWLSPAERQAAGVRRPASLAGLVAAKQALAAFFAGAGDFDPHEYRIGHAASGKPCILALPDGLARRGYRLEWCDLSISHSRTQARALVAGRLP